MWKFITVLFWVFIGLFVLSGFFGLLGAVLNLTFGLLGAVLSFIWKFVLIPVLLVLAVVWLVYRYRRNYSTR